MLLLHPALDFLFSLVFFFFFSSLNHQPFTPADTHRGSTPPRTDNALRESFLHTPPARPPPHQKTPLLSHTPSFRHTLSSCSGLRSGQFPGRVPAIILPGGIQRGATRQAARLEEYSFVSSSTCPTLQWCPRTPYRDDVLAPLQPAANPQTHTSNLGTHYLSTLDHISEGTRAPFPCSSETIHTPHHISETSRHPPYLAFPDCCSLYKLVPGDRDSFPPPPPAVIGCRTLQGFVGIQPILDQPPIQPQKKKRNK